MNEDKAGLAAELRRQLEADEPRLDWAGLFSEMGYPAETVRVLEVPPVVEPEPERDEFDALLQIGPALTALDEADRAGRLPELQDLLMFVAGLPEPVIVAASDAVSVSAATPLGLDGPRAEVVRQALQGIALAALDARMKLSLVGVGVRLNPLGELEFRWNDDDVN